MDYDLELLKPLIGYAMWYMQRDHTVPEILERMKNNPDLPQVNPDYHIRAIEVAQINNRLCDIIRAKCPTITYEECLQWREDEHLRDSVGLEDCLARLETLLASESSLDT